MTFHGITHPVPMWLLPLWRRFMCPRNYHLFDEVESMGGTPGQENYLSCDGCGLEVHINRIDDWKEGRANCIW